jgi:cell division protease FtsH
MVVEWGMSEKVGPLHYGSDQQEVFLGYSMGQSRVGMSDATLQLIDAEIKRLVNDAHAAATKILTEHRDQLDLLANALLEYETLSGDDIKALLAGEKLHRPDTSLESKTRKKSSLPSSRKPTEDGGDNATIH